MGERVARVNKSELNIQFSVSCMHRLMRLSSSVMRNGNTVTFKLQALLKRETRLPSRGLLHLLYSDETPLSAQARVFERSCLIRAVQRLCADH